EGRSGENTGRKAQEPRARAALVCFVERAGQNLLLDAFRIAGRRFPANAHVEGMKFVVPLVDAHGASPSVQEIDDVGGCIRLDRAQTPVLPAEEHQRLSSLGLIFM